MSQFEFEEDLPVLGPLEASDIKRGICRHMRNLNYSVLVEFRLKSKRRVDVMGLNRNGKFAIVEIKSSVNDFRSDKKWRDYRPFADQLYFAVANGFPIEILPKDCGVVIADAYHACILKEAPIVSMNGMLMEFANSCAASVSTALFTVRSFLLPTSSLLTFSEA